MGNVCPSGKVEQDGLCYVPCKDGYSGGGPICYGDCPPNTTDIGAVCTKHSYGRGVGTIPDQCPSGKVKDAGLCYDACREGYSGIATECYANCPAGFATIADVCAKPKGYGRGKGHFTKEECEKSKDRGAQEYGCEKFDLLWYPICAPNYKNFLCCLCVPECPSGWITKDEEFCERPRYDRGAGTFPSECPSGKIKQAGLCYDPCRSGYDQVGPVCWAQCSGNTTDTGTQCQKNSYGRGAGTIPDSLEHWFWIIVGVIGIALLIILIIYIVSAYRKN